ncbi:MAG: hypothetical protein ACI9QL_002176 [Candidatus Omnitrophota bacterium]|jgi:hypothetical protein
MKTILSCLLFLLLSAVVAQEAATPIDWDRAKALYQRDQRGETLAPDDQAYLNRAKEARRQRQQAGPAQADRAQRKAPARLIPLCDMSAEDRYEGQDGGLYGAGKNVPSAGQQARAEIALQKIQPLDAKGQPSPKGTIAFISISMSNATMEFSRFKQVADQSPDKSARVTIIDCAQGGQAMAQWVQPDAGPWKKATERIAAAGVTPEQVQVAWVKLANKSPSGSLLDHCTKLEADTIAVLHNARKRFPNLQVVYLGSRIWAGNAKGSLNPEPYAYESAFAVRNLIQRQAKGDAELAATSTPVLLWGPYLWAEGERGRKSDDLIWAAGDFAGDGVHPSNRGRDKVAGMLLDFCLGDPLAKRWFGKP